MTDDTHRLFSPCLCSIASHSLLWYVTESLQCVEKEAISQIWGQGSRFRHCGVGGLVASTCGYEMNESGDVNNGVATSKAFKTLSQHP